MLVLALNVEREESGHGVSGNARDVVESLAVGTTVVINDRLPEVVSIAQGRT